MRVDVNMLELSSDEVLGGHHWARLGVAVAAVLGEARDIIVTLSSPVAGVIVAIGQVAA